KLNAPDSRLRGNDGSGIPIVSPGGRGEMRNGHRGRGAGGFMPRISVFARTYQPACRVCA
ncbi:hypothetical protein, partial [Neisseria gonorrhoeae]|uniref:hypothetical protein n=1 Tax=Neisseria gonorrhoeae TaxID=485 RepID=UPI001E2CF259